MSDGSEASQVEVVSGGGTRVGGERARGGWRGGMKVVVYVFVCLNSSVRFVYIYSEVF